MAPDGRPRLVPICFTLGEQRDAAGRPIVYTPLDEKPKQAADPMKLARVQDLLVLPEATLLVDRWDEDWTRLAWLRAYGTAELLEPQPHEREEHGAAAAALKRKYPQYAGHALQGRPIVRIHVTRALSWGAIRSTGFP